MSSNDSNPPDTKQTARQLVEQCLQMVMSLKSNDLQDPQIRSGLLAMTETVQSLIQRSVPSVKAEAREAPEAVEEEIRPPQFWRVKSKTQAEKNDKKARLEKREAILRDLRSRVTQFKSENQDFDEQDSPSQETFESRFQRASYWPSESLEWARQLLGIELGMTAAEKRQRYLEMVKLCHPDQNRAVDPQAIQQVNAAWDIVCQ